MKKLIIISIIISISLTSSQLFSQKTDSLYVWAYPGLNIRQTEDPNSEIVSYIPFGEKTLPDWTSSNRNIELRIKESSYIGNKWRPEFFLNGKMVKIEYNGQVGFVFSGYLSSFPTFSTEVSFHDFLIERYDTIKTFKFEHTYHSDQTIFKNGIISFSYNECSGCAETTYIIPNLSLQEGLLIAYHIFRLDVSSNNEWQQWYVKTNKENHLEITGTLDLDFFIGVRKSYSYITLTIGSYN